MTVFFCGHRQVENSPSVSLWLEKAVCSLAEQGIVNFYLGGYGEFDHLAARAVHRAKSTYPSIQSTLILAYLTSEADMSLYDSPLYPPLENVPLRYAIPRRNRWAVDHADIVVACVRHSWGGAASTLGYAKRKKKIIIEYPQTFNLS